MAYRVRRHLAEPDFAGQEPAASPEPAAQDGQRADVCRGTATASELVDRVRRGGRGPAAPEGGRAGEPALRGRARPQGCRPRQGSGTADGGPRRDSTDPLQRLRLRGGPGHPRRRFRAGKQHPRAPGRFPPVGRNDVSAGEHAGRDHQAGTGAPTRRRAPRRCPAGRRRSHSPCHGRAAGDPGSHGPGAGGRVRNSPGRGAVRRGRGCRHAAVEHPAVEHPRTGVPALPRRGAAPGRRQGTERPRCDDPGHRGRRGRSRGALLPHRLPRGPFRGRRNPLRRLAGGGKPPDRLRRRIRAQPDFLRRGSARGARHHPALPGQGRPGPEHAKCRARSAAVDRPPAAVRAHGGHGLRGSRRSRCPDEGGAAPRRLRGSTRGPAAVHALAGRDGRGLWKGPARELPGCHRRTEAARPTVPGRGHRRARTRRVGLLPGPGGHGLGAEAARAPGGA